MAGISAENGGTINVSSPGTSGITVTATETDAVINTVGSSMDLGVGTVVYTDGAYMGIRQGGATSSFTADALKVTVGSVLP